MSGDTRIRAVSAPWYDGVEILIAEYGFNNKMHAVADQISFKALDDFSYVTPSFRISRDSAQQLMDELWHCGLRPTNGSGSAGALAATEKHLQDMRELVFKK